MSLTEVQNGANEDGANRADRLHVAFDAIDGSGWTGGVHYIKNLIFALDSLRSEGSRPEISILATSAMVKPYEDISTQIDRFLLMPEIQPLSLRKRFTRRIYKELRLPPVKSLTEQILQKNNVDAFFSLATHGDNFAIPLMAWIYDFQHLHLPEMHPASDIEARNSGFRTIAQNATTVIVSSQNAKRDYENFAPQFAQKARVVSFVAQVPPDIYTFDPANTAKKYNLPERFFYLPNQFWKHKNHGVVLKALHLLKAQGQDMAVVCTGLTHDFRNPSFFPEFMCRVSELGLRDNFIVLGFVSYVDTFQLTRQSIAVLQPSKFEGWSTTVEEVKSIGKPIIASDFPVHIEQNPPEARFFAQDDPEDLADCMMEAWETRQPGPTLDLEYSASSNLLPRTQTFGREFLEICWEAAQTKARQVKKT